jgi:predicted amidophosphoribosyltransferase
VSLTRAVPVYSHYHITSKDNIPFAIEEYSRFKYGSKRVARIFGRELADGYVQSEEFLHACQNDRQIVVLASPYSFIPTACHTLKDYFIARLNQHLIERGRRPVQESKIVRTHSYIDDYGEMSAEKRAELIKREAFYTDKLFLEGKHILFLDDIKITGAHQRGVEAMIYNLGIDRRSSYTFLYYAELTNLQEDPSIENYLNYADVTDLVSLNDIIHNDEFVFNTRCVKFMLGSPSAEFATFIIYQSKAFRETLLTLATGNSYHLVPDYKLNFNLLRRQVHKDHG